MNFSSSYRLFFAMIGILLFGVNQLFGALLTGSEIHYSKVDSLKYDVFYIFYRSCGGTDFTMSSVDCYVSNDDGDNPVTLTPTLVSITDITPVCNSASKPCSPSNTSYTGNGLEKHLYKITIDFTKSDYSKIYKSGKPIIFSVTHCCRSANITNGAANQYHYNYALLDLNVGEVSGLHFNATAVSDFGINNTIFYTMSARGFQPNDSISYAFGDVLSGRNQKISTNALFKAYDPTGKGVVNPNSNPAIGLYLDKRTGDVIFTPVDTSDQPVVVMEATVWRRDTTGKLRKVSVIRRDIAYKSSEGSAPPSPRIFYGGSQTICEGENLDLLFSTRQSKDTIYLFLADSILGSSNQIIDTSHQQQLKFTWTPKIGSARTQPYKMLLLAVDSACPRVIKSYSSYLIYVKPKLNVKVEVNSLNCDVLQVKSTPESGTSIRSFSWRVLDSSGTSEQDESVIYFPSTHSARSNYLNDSFYVRKPGTYIVEHTVLTSNYCQSIWYDTIQVVKSSSKLFRQTDTLLCGQNQIAIVQNIQNDSIFSSYRWSSGDTTKSTQLKYSGYSRKVFLRANLKSGCFYFDDIQVNQAERPKIANTSPVAHCIGQDTLVKAKVSNPYSFMATSVFWDLNKTDSLNITQFGTYHITAQNACGITKDSVLAVKLDEPKVDLGAADTFACAGKDLLLSPKISGNNPPYKYLWSDSSSFSTLKINKLGTYFVAVSNSCGKQSDTIVVSKFKTKPNINLGNEALICDGVPAKLGGDYPDTELLWSTGETSNYISVSTPQKVILTATNTCGVSEDSVEVVAKKSPKIFIQGDTFFCAKVPIQFFGGLANAEYSWSTGEKTRIVFISKAGNYWVKAINGCGMDSFGFRLTEKQKPIVNLGPDTSLFAGPITLDAGTDGTKYLWSTGEQTRKIQVVQQGQYWAEVTNVCGTTRDYVLVKFGGVKDGETSKFKLYPNPSNGSFTIETKFDLNENQIDLMALDGSILSGEMIQFKEAGLQTIKFEVNTELHGVYFLRIIHAGGIQHIPIILN